jgi:hypothetical protein
VKFDDLLAQYLYEHKILQLQGIGSFSLEGKVSVPYDQEKEIYYPIEGLTFTHNNKEIIDENLVAFLVQKLGKIQPLVRSDLESYLSNIKQFINLGKPYTIEGVGTLHKNNYGTYEFTPGNFLPVKEELNPKRENPDHNYPQKTSNTAGRAFLIFLIVVISLAVLGGIGWGIYTLVVNNKPAAEEQPVTTTETTDTLTSTTGIDTASTQLPGAVSPAATDTVAYKMIFEITPSKKRAIARTGQLQTLKINAKYDSVQTGELKKYRIYVIKRLTASDTLRIRDSIARFFLKTVTIDRQ